MTAKNTSKSTAKKPTAKQVDQQAADVKAEVVEKDIATKVASEKEQQIAEANTATTTAEESKDPQDTAPASDELFDADGLVITDNVSNDVLSIAQIMNGYLVSMRPGRAKTPKSGGEQQELFSRTITRILQSPPEQFKDQMDLLLKIVDRHRDGCFADTHVHRFLPEADLNEMSFRAHECVVALLLATVDSNKAQAVKTIDLNKLTALFNDGRAVENLNSYWG